MIVNDTCNFHQACVHPNDIDSDPNTFYCCLAEEMIDNQFDEVALQPMGIANIKQRDNNECSKWITKVTFDTNLC